MTHVTCRLTVKNLDQLWSPTLSNPVWAAFTFYFFTLSPVNKHTSHSDKTRTFNGPFLGLPRWAGTRKVKPIWILLKQETVSGSGISWATCKSAPSASILPLMFFTGRMPFLMPNKQRQCIYLLFRKCCSRCRFQPYDACHHPLPSQHIEGRW